MALLLRLEPYDPDAYDGDGDGIVQEGTAWERPAGTRILNELGEEIQRGITATSRPSLRIVDANGLDVSYRPSYFAGTAGKEGKKVSSTLGRVGFPSLAERGFPQLSEMVGTVDDIVTSPMRDPQVRLDDYVQLVLNSTTGRARTEAVEIKAKADSLIEALKETTQNKDLLASLLLGGAYWATTFFNAGDIGAQINDITTGVLDSDATERLAVLANVFVIGGQASLNHAIRSVQERWNITKEQASQLRDAIVARFEKMKLKAGELSERMKQQLAQLSASIGETLRNIRRSSLADAVPNVFDGPKPVDGIYEGLIDAERLTPEDISPDLPDLPPDKKPSEDDLRKLEDIVDREVPALRRIRKIGGGERQRKRAHEQAQAGAWDGGNQYVIETEDKLYVLDDMEYGQLVKKIRDAGLDPSNLNITKFGKPEADVAGLEEIRAKLAGIKDLPIDDAKYRDAVMALHHGSASLDDIDDDVFAAAVFDEDLFFPTGGADIVGGDETVVRAETLLNGDVYVFSGTEFSNRRFTFRAIKGNDGVFAYGGLWSVFKVTDKETGEVWYLKTSTYGSNDAMLESVGMELSSVLGLPVAGGTRDIRISPNIPLGDVPGYETSTGDIGVPPGRIVRWTAMRNIDDWKTTIPLKTQQDEDGEIVTWLDAGKVSGGLDQNTVDVGDMAGVLVFDYILDNLDRHTGNFKIGYDEQGWQRLGLIDNGLLFGGRLRDHSERTDVSEVSRKITWEEEGTAEDFIELADSRAGLSPSEFAEGKVGNILLAGLDTFALRILLNNANERDTFDAAVASAIEKLEEQIEQVLSPDRFARAGVQLSEIEEAHLASLLHVARTRLKYLKDNPDAFLEAFETVRDTHAKNILRQQNDPRAWVVASSGAPRPITPGGTWV